MLAGENLSYGKISSVTLASTSTQCSLDGECFPDALTAEPTLLPRHPTRGPHLTKPQTRVFSLAMGYRFLPKSSQLLGHHIIDPLECCVFVDLIAAKGVQQDTREESVSW